MSNPFFSVIIPTYNNQEFLLDALDSLFNQTTDDYEILVIDDGSTDGTADALNHLHADARLSYFYQDNSGPATARNTGIKNAKGQYITFLDSDDLLQPDCLSSIRDSLLKYPEIGLIFTNYDIFYNTKTLTESGVDIWKIFRTIPSQALGDSLYRFNVCLTPFIIKHGSFMHTSGLTISRSCIESCRMFVEGFFYGEDDEFWSRIAYHCESGYIDRILSRKRVHPMSIASDHRHISRNIRNQIDLSEIQRDLYKNDQVIQKILDDKIPRLSGEYCWHLQAIRHYTKARLYIFENIKRHPLSIQFYKLLIKNILCTPLFNPRREGA